MHFSSKTEPLDFAEKPTTISIDDKAVIIYHSRKSPSVMRNLGLRDNKWQFLNQKRVRMHYIKYARIWIFTDPYSPV